MMSIYEIGSWSNISAFLVWTLAVCTVAKALFGSMPAAELQFRFMLRDAPRRQRIERLNWEISNQTKWNEAVARGSSHAAVVPLSDGEVRLRQQELQPLMRSSFVWRACTYFMGCFACQAFWTAIGIYALTRGIADLEAWFFSAAAYAGAAVLLLRVHDMGAKNSSKRQGCT